uniref:Hyaluronidase n=1 Tax=Phidippus regius TaxID=1905328 RepID=A0A482Z6I3_9ARAC
MRSFLFFFFLGIVSGYEIYWNVPTFQCSRNYGIDFISLLQIYGIRANLGDKFQGDNITIFYEEQLGLYPRILKTGKFENGGIPQNGDLEKHLKKASKDLKKVIPSEDFDGLGVIDWEAWRPVWEFNWEPLRIYQTKSIEEVKKQQPNIKNSMIQETARQQWELSTKLYMLRTLQLAKERRPKARWCYYLFPDCYNYNGKRPKDFQCSTSIRKGNDKLSWLWKESTAVCPSIYVHKSQLDHYTFEERTWRDNEKLKEAFRVASDKAKIFPYINYFSDKLLPGEEFWRMLAQTAASGSNGAVIWGASASVASENHCKNLKRYIKDVIGPAAEKISWRSDLCSKQICHGKGQCTFPNDEYAKAWKLFTDDDTKNFYAGDITCRCFENYKGRFCSENLN